MLCCVCGRYIGSNRSSTGSRSIELYTLLVPSHRSAQIAQHIRGQDISFRLTRQQRSSQSFLGGILFLLTVAASHTLGRQNLVAKRWPRTKVFAALAPLDFELVGVVQNHPDGDITRRADALVLSWDDVRRALIHALHQVTAFRGSTAHERAGGRDTELATHDTEALPTGRYILIVAVAATSQIIGIVDQKVKVGDLDRLDVHLTLSIQRGERERATSKCESNGSVNSKP